MIMLQSDNDRDRECETGKTETGINKETNKTLQKAPPHYLVFPPSRPIYKTHYEEREGELSSTLPRPVNSLVPR